MALHTCKESGSPLTIALDPCPHYFSGQMRRESHGQMRHWSHVAESLVAAFRLPPNL